MLYNVLTSPKRMRTLLAFNSKGYLDETGWFNAFFSHSPVDVDGNPIPWVTYSFIDFINERLNKRHTVFEFGSGNSTFFYSKHAAKVVSVEHDRDWYDNVLRLKPENAELIYCQLRTDGDYCRTPLKLQTKFDIIIIDGRDRVNCCKQAISSLSAGGVIILDDAEREKYAEGLVFLKTQGFKQLSFTGISPGLFYLKATSVFYKPGNCLGV